MILFVTADVFLRYVFQRPIEASSETVEFMMVFVFAWGIAYAQQQKKHIAVDALINRLSPRAQAIIDTIVYFMSLIYLLLLTWQALAKAQAAFTQGVLSFGKVLGITSVPLYPFFYLVGLALISLVMMFLTDFLVSLSRAMEK
jgi:TRAP-type C4-dicarboxylate transport system permease small subunit